MNIFSDNEKYKNLVVQFDLLNTINGGSIAVNPQFIRDDDQYTLVLKTPSISANNINLVLDGDKFIIFTWVANLNEATNQTYPKAPCFITTVPVPVHSDVENIKAFYKNEVLKVSIPIDYNNKINPRKRIKINHG